MGLQPGAGTLERTVPESASGLPREQRQPLESPGNGAGTGLCAREMENRKIEIFRFEYSTEPRFVFPRMPLRAPTLLNLFCSPPPLTHTHPEIK